MDCLYGDIHKKISVGFNPYRGFFVIKDIMVLNRKMMIGKDTPQYAAVVLVILYSVGILGFSFPIIPHFAHLTPLNLAISLILVLWYEPAKTTTFWRWAFFTAILGYTVEAIGVGTGLIFGQYQYGPVLGFKLFDTPLSIAINWLLLAYAAAIVSGYMLSEAYSFVLRAALAAVLMVALDVLIEPIAVKTNMWTWAGDVIPLQNYVGWFVVSFIIQTLFFRFHKPAKNKVAVVLLVLQYAFFAILNLILG